LLAMQQEVDLVDVVHEPVGKVRQVLDCDGPVEEPLEVGRGEQLRERVSVALVDAADEDGVLALGPAQLELLLGDLGVERRDLAPQCGDPPLGGGNLVHRLVAGVARLLELLQQGNLLRSEEHTSELQSPYDLVCRLLLEKKKTNIKVY